jgi:RNA polymerase sigma-70 factor (ECF subfamily)
MEKNHANFTALHNTTYNSLFNFIHLRVRDREEATDLVQEVYLKAYNSWGLLPEPQTAKNFLFYIARQKMIDLWKSARIRYSSDADINDVEFDEADGDSLPETLFEKSEREAEALDILNSLKPGERDILYLRFIEEKSYEEISEILKISGEYARQKVARALAKAKQVAKGRNK